MSNEKADRYTSVNGLRTRYWTNNLFEEKVSNEKSKADKPIVVFFHGFSFSLDDWKRIQLFEPLQLQGFPIVAVDLPSGKSSKSDKISHTRIEDYLPWMETFFALLGLNKPNPHTKLIIVGPSMGGGFALTYALAHPEQMAGLILVSPSLRSIAEEKLEDLLVPAMLVWGEKDNVFPAQEYANQLKNKLAHSKLIIIKGAGHASYLDKPEEFKELFLDFLEELS